ncbi:MAG: hypothetical protein JWM82_1837 [Myxococcales bacterium]|nr:hypothetical protein [Myxococcales bacterium]
MATKIHLRCTACGSLRRPEAFGIEKGRFDERSLLEYESALGTQEIGGRGKCSWDFSDLPIEYARAILHCLHRAAERLEGEIATAEANGS